jgi:hypothetical protein
MRSLRFAPLLLMLLPCAASCNSDKYPDGDIGYGPCVTDGATSNGGSSNGNGGTSARGGKGGASSAGKGGSDTPQAGDGPALDECGQAWSEPPDTSECDLEALEDSGQTIGEVNGLYRSITKDTTLAGGKTYKLDGLTVIEPGVTLTIEKCTKIFGQGSTSVLITDSGLTKNGSTYSGSPPGRLVAEGEQNAPIVFTSRKAPGTRVPGDWGGVVLSGKAPENTWVNLGAPPVVEGIVERNLEFGWKTDEYAAEDSGSLKYVRIEYAGHEVSATIETNGLTLNAVGSGTTLSHIMVSNSLDDCFEWFGGTVNADHLIALNCDDDAFDTDLGYSGHVQFGFSRQFPTSKELDSNGFESDNNKDSEGGSPRTTARFSNVTMCGSHTGLFQTAPRYGAVLRRGTQISIINTLITGFDTAGLTVRDDSSSPTISYSSIFDNALLFDPTDSMNRASEEWLAAQEGNSIEAPAGFCDCYAEPPLPFPTEPIPGGPPGAGFVDADANYEGAFKDSTPASNWMSGQWVDWAAN